jgi:hypothetical protein
MGYEMTFDRTTAAKGRNGWFILDHGEVLLGQDASWLELSSKRLGNAAPISVRFAHPTEMHQLGAALLKAATEWGAMRDSSGGLQTAARSPSPCPQCGGKDLWIRVTQHAEQKIALHGPCDGEYHYDVLHEDVQGTTYHAATCRACEYVWVLA